MTHIAVDDHGTALDDPHRKPAMNLPFDGIELDDVENERLARECRLPADADPLVGPSLVHDDIGEYPERASSWFRQSESFVASSIRHGHAGEQRPYRDEGLRRSLPVVTVYQ